MGDSIWWNIVDAQFVVSVLTVVYYSWILLLISMSTSSVFRSAFYRMFIVTGFFDIQGILIVEWIRIDQHLAFGRDWGIINRIIYSLSFSHFFIHVIGCLLMTINRYMGVCHPISYEKCWKPCTVNVMLCAVILISFIVHTEVFLIEIVYQWKGSRWVYAGRLKPIPFYRIMCACLVIVYELASIILTALTIYSITKSGKKKEKKKFTKEMGLLIAMIIECFLGAIECIYEVVNAFGFKNINHPMLNFIRENFCLFLFVVFAMDSYGIMFMSTELRKEVIRFCKRMLRILRCCGTKEVDKYSVHDAFSFSSNEVNGHQPLVQIIDSNQNQDIAYEPCS